MPPDFGHRALDTPICLNRLLVQNISSLTAFSSSQRNAERGRQRSDCLCTACCCARGGTRELEVPGFVPGFLRRSLKVQSPLNPAATTGLGRWMPTSALRVASTSLCRQAQPFGARRRPTRQGSARRSSLSLQIPAAPH